MNDLVFDEIFLKAGELIDISSFEGISFGFAESLTGGLIAASVVNVPGASRAFTLSFVRLCATPRTAAYQAPPSMGFSRRKYWSGLPLPSPI